MFVITLIVATIDDISVFVIPIWPYKVEVMEDIAIRQKRALLNLAAERLSNGNRSDMVICEDSVLNGDEIDLLVRTNPKVPKLRDVSTNESKTGQEVQPVPLILSEELMIADSLPVNENSKKLTENKPATLNLSEELKNADLVQDKEQQPTDTPSIEENRITKMEAEESSLFVSPDEALHDNESKSKSKVENSNQE